MFSRLKSGVKKFWAAVALLSVELVIILLLFFTAMFGFILLARRILLHRKEDFDFKVFEWLAQHVSDSNTRIMQLFSFFGDHTFLIPANLILIAWFLFVKKHRWYSIKIPVVAISSVVLMFLLKMIFQRPRPSLPLMQEARGLSFPSGHAMTSVTFYGLMIYLIWINVKNVYWKWSLTIFTIILILFIGTSRIYLRVHYISDVIAGYCVGVIWLVLSLSVLKKMERYSRKKVDPVVQAADPASTLPA